MWIRMKSTVSKQISYQGIDKISWIKFMVTGAVLLIAVTIDAYSRARRETAGQA